MRAKDVAEAAPDQAATWITLPNLITSLRLILAPVIVALIVMRRPLAAGWVFGFAAATDLVDGGLARRFGSVTPAGQYLDPVADKILMGSVFLALAWADRIPVWYVALIFSRDVLLLAFSAIALRWTTYRELQPTVWGKLSTFFQICVAVFVMAADAFDSERLRSVSGALIWTSAGMTAWSWMHYAWRGIRGLRAAL